MPMIKPQFHSNTIIRSLARSYATVDAATIVARPPRTPIPVVEPEFSIQEQILTALSQPGFPRNQPSLPQLLEQYANCSGHVLDYSLPYELCPTADRKVNFDATTEENVSMIAHYVREGDKHKFTLSSGFALEAPGHRPGESLMLTCAHTLEEARYLPIDVLITSWLITTLDRLIDG
jgi:hypothetical protein